MSSASYGVTCEIEKDVKRGQETEEKTTKRPRKIQRGRGREKEKLIRDINTRAVIESLRSSFIYESII